MTYVDTRRDGGLGWSFGISAAIHLSLAAAILFGHFSSPTYTEAPIYYVDVVNLPVAAPRAGRPAVDAGSPAAPTAPPQSSQEMALPRKSSRPAASRQPTAAKAATGAETSKEFEDRLAGLRDAVDAHHQEAALDALRKKLTNSRTAATPGMPGATGTQTGSDYGSYIQSRLKDAFHYTIAYQSKAPAVFVRLTIDGSGHVVGQHIEQSTGDRIFEDSVLKAIVRAEKTFPPPPSGRETEIGFVFRPQGVGKK
ncbi:energy transduction protein TonB [Geotalea uraniireducens]|uniref:Energy transduction protein TonB n=1 Tax=Geotalea uraniireducens TaxID=351604 RepID=A0ABN6VPB8_9BACT|nr:TonB family protein [Geotalea uraniireducens]BDV41107.1 energy transduction protein TonB [Geotalea uraniireducens]